MSFLYLIYNIDSNIIEIDKHLYGIIVQKYWLHNCRLSVYLQCTSQKFIKNSMPIEICNICIYPILTKITTMVVIKTTPHLFNALIHGIFYVYIMLSKQKVEVKRLPLWKVYKKYFSPYDIWTHARWPFFLESNLMQKCFWLLWEAHERIKSFQSIPYNFIQWK